MWINIDWKDWIQPSKFARTPKVGYNFQKLAATLVCCNMSGQGSFSYHLKIEGCERKWAMHVMSSISQDQLAKIP